MSFSIIEIFSSEKFNDPQYANIYVYCVLFVHDIFGYLNILFTKCNNFCLLMLIEMYLLVHMLESNYK